MSNEFFRDPGQAFAGEKRRGVKNSSLRFSRASCPVSGKNQPRDLHAHRIQLTSAHGPEGIDDSTTGSYQRNAIAVERVVAGAGTVDAGCRLGAWSTRVDWVVGSNDVALTAAGKPVAVGHESAKRGPGDVVRV